MRPDGFFRFHWFWVGHGRNAGLYEIRAEKTGVPMTLKCSKTIEGRVFLGFVFDVTGRNYAVFVGGAPFLKKSGAFWLTPSPNSLKPSLVLVSPGSSVGRAGD